MREILNFRSLAAGGAGGYVEVGAFHPVSISDTYLFYRKVGAES